ncbi:lysylphosphatidylglycerol synthase transmembrane domain-containing protein [Thermoflavifilum aggregans]|uniref:lysylphosphatidylglycerol synthase transmembrane domain-containing protein n=1 Tax=Thermoflavifilum aggregans TaxID=454188 RepID=UPI0012FF3445|nr:lysylphosphatidylglycerol synthase transmembrane domain-containing protein [Thermoflavifilum aggregans]
MKTAIKWLLKILVTGAALYITFRKVNWSQTREVLLHVRILWLIIALVLFNLSQLSSAWRLFYFYRALDIPLSLAQNIKLYYIGMFYNLFLPGGIGGDGYKIHYLYRFSQKSKSLKSLFTATFLDRLQGLWALILLLSAILFMATGRLPAGWQSHVRMLVAGLLLACLIYAELIWILFRIYRRVFLQTAFAALVVQVCQLLAAWALLHGLGMKQEIVLYLILFLCSSIAAVIPFTIGGMGARELVFVWGASVLPIHANQAIAMSLLFFLLTACSSFMGAFLSMPRQPVASSA